MGRGKNKPVGAENVSANGYAYIKVGDGSWRLKHHIVAEQQVIGRSLRHNERVSFRDGDRTNFDPDNLVVREIQSNDDTRIEWLKSKIREYQEELDALLAKASQGA